MGGSLQYEQAFSRGRIAIAYDRSARVAGVIGEAATSQSLTATVTLSATRELTLSLESAIRATETADATSDFLVYTAAIRVDYRLLQWLSLSGGYRYLRQDDRVGALDLDRNVIFIALTASTEFRVY